MGDDDPGPSAVEPNLAFYGLWPRFTDPAGEGLEQATLHDGERASPVSRTSGS
jgi:hypothetical protein